MRKVVIVCGYGCHLTDKLCGYLDYIAGYLIANKNDIYLIITSGGCTNKKTAPGVSEAVLVKNYLGEKLRMVKVGLAFVGEDEAVTTPDNLEFSARLIQELRMPFRDEYFEAVIFCDSIRAFKVRYLAKRLLPGGMGIQVVGYDFRRSVRDKVRQYLITTPLEIVSFYIPQLYAWLRNERLALNENR